MISLPIVLLMCWVVVGAATEMVATLRPRTAYSRARYQFQLVWALVSLGTIVIFGSRSLDHLLFALFMAGFMATAGINLRAVDLAETAGRAQTEEYHEACNRESRWRRILFSRTANLLVDFVMALSFIGLLAAGASS